MPDTAQKRGYEVAEEAFAAFDAWLAAQPDETHMLSLLEQIDLYAESSRAWQAAQPEETRALALLGQIERYAASN